MRYKLCSLLELTLRIQITLYECEAISHNSLSAVKDRLRAHQESNLQPQPTQQRKCIVIAS